MNAAGGQLSGRVAPGEVVSIFGLNVGPAAPVSAAFDAAGFLPVSLGGISVTVGGVPAPLLYVSSTQINAVMPLELTPGASASLRVSINGAALPDFRVMADAAIPQVFQSAVNQDGSINSQGNPAPVGSIVSVWATGVGSVDGLDGQMATVARDLCGCVIHDLDQNQDLTGIYAGTAPGTVTGVIQINFKVTPYGYYQLRVNGKFSDPFYISIKR